MSAGKAVSLKEAGNRHFQAGDYVSAEGLYSKAIIADPRSPALYTNRAMARLKLSLWDSVIADCNDCLALAPDSVKAHYYLAQAHLALRAFDDALGHGLRAHALCAVAGDKSLPAITALVLRVKGERWEALERRRVRQHTELEAEVLALMDRERDMALREATGPSEHAEIADEWRHKTRALRDVFEKARGESQKKRVVPDWAIDDISFGVMVDPVLTKTGKSYERASVLEHLRRQETDPLTREPLLPSDLRPNLQLKQACDEFLEENGWAVDW